MHLTPFFNDNSSQYPMKFQDAGKLIICLILCLCSSASYSAKMKDVVADYAKLVLQNYEDVSQTLKVMDLAIDNFIKSPSSASLERAKRAWLDSRYVYGQTEVFRFYEGPIDNEKNGPEGQINAWPLDEAYIDYVEGAPNSGIIQNPKIKISKTFLKQVNEGSSGDLLKEGKSFDPEKAISTGYHAIEFLLWGQDRDPSGPGSRNFSDYVNSKSGPGRFAARRAKYLKLTTEILIEDVNALIAAWKPGRKNYQASFLSNPKISLKNILVGMGTLAKGELASERIDVALDTLDQEDEHSCFSDNTHIDIYTNVLGIYNVYRGAYDLFEGKGVRDLLPEKQQEKLDLLFHKTLSSVKEMPQPFDQVISKKNSPGWKKAQIVVNNLYELADEIASLGKVLHLGNIPVTLPE